MHHDRLWLHELLPHDAADLTRYSHDLWLCLLPCSLLLAGDQACRKRLKLVATDVRSRMRQVYLDGFEDKDTLIQANMDSVHVRSPPW